MTLPEGPPPNAARVGGEQTVLPAQLKELITPFFSNSFVLQYKMVFLCFHLLTLSKDFSSEDPGPFIYSILIAPVWEIVFATPRGVENECRWSRDLHGKTGKEVTWWHYHCEGASQFSFSDFPDILILSHNKVIPWHFNGYCKSLQIQTRAVTYHPGYTVTMMSSIIPWNHFSKCFS